MKESKLIQILKSLSPQELGQFERYVHSPFFHIHQPTIRLFEALKVHYPDFLEEFIHKEAIFEYVYPGKKYKDALMRQVMSYLQKLLFEYLGTMAELEVDKESYIPIIHTLVHRDLYKSIPHFLNREEQRLAAKVVPDTQDLYSFMLLADSKIDLWVKNPRKNTLPPLKEASHFLDCFFCLKKLRYACAILSTPQLEDDENMLLEPVLLFCQTHDLSQWPLIYLYYLMYQLMKQGFSANLYTSFRDTLISSDDQLPQKEAINLYVFALNLCNARLRQGETEMNQEIFDLYKRMLEKELVFEAGKLSTRHFSNIVILGLRLKEWQWVETFVLAYGPRLDTPYAQDSIHFSLAQLFFFKQDYSLSLKRLNNMQLIDLGNRLKHHILNLKIYYLQEEEKSFSALCDSFNVYLYREKELTKAQKKSYLNYIKWIKKLYDCRQIPFYRRARETEKLLRALKRAALMVEKNWLVDEFEHIMETLEA